MRRTESIGAAPIRNVLVSVRGHGKKLLVSFASEKILGHGFQVNFASENVCFVLDFGEFPNF